MVIYRKLLLKMDNNVLPKVQTGRTFFDTLGSLYAPDSRVQANALTVDGVPCVRFTPESTTKRSIILYLHGGAFVFGSIRSHTAMVSHFASAFSTDILFVEYSLAPEHPYPAAVLEVIRVFRTLLEDYSPSEIIFMGDSAGGGLAATAIARIAAEGLPAPGAVVLLSPWLNLTCNTTTYLSHREVEKVLTQEGLLEYAGYYVGDALDEADPSRLTFSSFPPLLLLVGSDEILLDDSRLFFEQIKAVQSSVKLSVYGNQGHVWFLMDIGTTASKLGLAEIAAFISTFR